MADNFLKYTGLNYSEIYAQIRDRINADSRFDNFRESAIAQTLIEIFAGTTDIANYYIQRRAEECYFDTAQLKSSVISLSRQLGYVVTRQQPAKMKMKIILEGDFTGMFDTTPGADNKIQIPYYSKFTIDGKDFVLIDTMTYNITESVLSKMATQTTNFKMEIVKDSFDNDIMLAQGQIKEKVIIGNTNPQVGSNFQIYKIEDKEFSDIFGDKDYFHNPVTKVYVGNQKDSTTEYSIDRRSLINWESLASNDLSEASKICVIRTSPDEGVEILFGDGGFAAKGALTREDNIYIQYLSTKGKSANKIGVIANKINYSGSIYTNRGVDISSKVSFEAYSNITGGADLEDIDSIKYSAPKIYYSLDRLVTKDDYINYLKTLKSPIEVKNAIAWGEQEERDKNGVFADIKMFNVGFFSVIGSLYNLDGNVYNSKSKGDNLDSIVLDLDYDPDEIQIQSYFNVYTRQAQANQLKQYDVVSYYNKFNGTAVENTITPSFLAAKYGDNARLTFTYTSNITDNASNITATGSAICELSTLTSTSTMHDVASAMTVKLSQFKDVRANSYDNLNYGSVAFTSAIETPMVVWNAEDSRFEVSFGEDTPSYPISFTGEFASTVGLAGASLFSVAITDKEEISGRIIQVVDDLNSRGQMNINNIYISPIIHNFNIGGKVYIKPLFDKEQLKTEINNSIYSWLDLNADFNEPIRLSNIVELIEKNPGVVNANLELTPEDITNGYNAKDNKYYLGWKDGILNSGPPLGGYGKDFARFFGSEIMRYVGVDGELSSQTLRYINDSLNTLAHSTSGIGGDTFDQSDVGSDSYDPIDNTRYFYNSIPIYKGSVSNKKTIEKEYYYLNNFINERTFFNTFVKSVYAKVLKLAEEQPAPLDPTHVNDKSYVYGKDKKGVSLWTPNYKRFISYTAPESTYRTSNRYTSVDINSDFVKVIGKIHKDLSYLIKLNMVDSYGNIEEEYDANGKYVRGGYSLGSEIVKISLAPLVYEYK